MSELPVEGSAAPAAPNSVAAMPASESLPDKQPLLRQPPLQRLPDTGLTNPDTVYPVDLCIVLRLADGRNPTIGLAREMIRENLALQRAASVLLLPTLNGGGTYVGHAGDLQRSTGAILDVSRQSFYYGGGAQVWGSGTVNIPAVMIYSHLGDAYFEPLAARQRTRMSEFDARATANTQLLDVTTFYLRLVAAEANLQIYQVSRRDMDEVVRGTGAFAEIGQGRRSDADRALTEARLLDSQELAVEERVVVAAARLSGALNLDPSTRLRARGGEIPIVDLVDGSYTLAALQQIAYENRPEIAARNAGVAMMETRVKQEKTRPLLPTVAIGFSGGVFGGGSNLVMPLFGRFDGRSDFDAMAYWSAENLGVGNLALTRNRRAQRDQAWGERMRTVNRVRREVSDAYAASQAQTRNLAVARERLAAAEQGYQEDLARIRGGQGLPIELLDSLQRLVAARQAVVASAIGYDEAQFRLFVALGQPPTVALPRAQALCEPLPEAPMADSPAQ
ncbi:MAG TPA: TolC family protein [Pirellulales bacterium]|nr:TolC family protein [Pirellulales bacterium]